MCATYILVFTYINTLLSSRLPDSAIDIIDEASAAAKVTREAGPEDIDLLNREKARLKMDLESLEVCRGSLSISVCHAKCDP